MRQEFEQTVLAEGTPDNRKNNNQKYIDALREAADFLEQHPDLPPLAIYTSRLRLWASAGSKRDMAGVIRSCGGEWKKDVSAYAFFVTRDINSIFGLGISASRDVVCTARKVVKTIPAKPELVLPAQPERVEEVIEWECPDSILNPDDGGEQANAAVVREAVHS